jgi:hypothetical protein
MCDVLNNRVQVAVWNSTIDVAQPTPAMLPDAASKHDAASTLSILGFVVVSLVALVVLLQRKRKRKAVTAAKTTIKNWPLRIASGLVLVAAIAAPFLPSDLADGIAPYVFQDDGTYRRPVGPILGDSSWLAFVVIVGGIMATASVVTVSLYRYWVTPKFRNRLWERYREKHYVFDSMVGEWQRVTDRGIGGSVLVSTLSRNKRLVREARNIGSIARSSAICCLVPGLWLGGFLTMWRTDLGWKIAFFLSLPMFWLPIFLWWEQTTSFRDYALVIDPPAVMPDMTPYGDTTPFRTPPAESDETDYPMPV